MENDGMIPRVEKLETSKQFRESTGTLVSAEIEHNEVFGQEKIEMTECRPGTTADERRQFESMLAKFARVYPGSDFDRMDARERELFVGLAEYHGYARVLWVLQKVQLSREEPTTEAVEYGLAELWDRERMGIDPTQRDREETIVDLVINALDHGRFSNMNEFFKGREGWDNLRVRKIVWDIMLL